MSYPPLTQDGDLSGYPGAPFTDAQIRAAEASVRGDARWHITPVVTETLVVECIDPFRLVIPTLRIVSVASVTGDDTVAVTGYRVRNYGTIFPAIGKFFTVGSQYTVVLTHGYDNAYDLLPVIASRCLRQTLDSSLSQRSETVGQRTSSESYNTNRVDEQLGAGAGSPLDRYTLPGIG